MRTTAFVQHIMASNPWTADLEKVKKELGQRIDKLEASKPPANADAAKATTLLQRQVAELKNETEASDRRITVDMQKINAVFVNAKAADDAMQKQIADLKAKVDVLMKAASQKKP